jgi:hypothetical protein
MPIINRDLARSEQKDWETWASTSQVSTGATQYIVGPIPYNYTIQSARVAAVGVSGAMQLSFGIQRFVPTSGLTLINIGLSNLVLQNLGTSGVLGYSGLAIPGSTLLNGLPGDILMFTSSVANSAASTLLIQMVWFKTNDIVAFNGREN